MKIFTSFVKISLITLSLSFAQIQANEILVRSPNGEKFLIQVNPEDQFSDVLKRIYDRFDLTPTQQEVLQQDIRLDFMLANLGSKNIGKPAKKITRAYENPATKEEAKNIHYIVYTLGTKPLLFIIKQTFKLKKTGDKIDNVHPFRFLEVIFTDEKSKACMPNIRKSTFVWPEFKNGLYTSLSEEKEKDNLKTEYIQDFAKNVGIDCNLIFPSIQKGDWNSLVDILIANVPREGNPGRYNM